MSAANIAYDEVVPALRRSERAIVRAVTTRTLDKGERFNVPIIYQNYNDLIEDLTINAIYIPLPNSLHAEWAIKEMNNGKHVLLKKPATITENETIAIKETAEKNEVIFMEAFMYQFHTQHNLVKSC